MFIWKMVEKLENEDFMGLSPGKWWFVENMQGISRSWTMVFRKNVRIFVDFHPENGG